MEIDRRKGRDEQRRELDLVQGLNAAARQPGIDDPMLDARIQSLEMAYRMQIEATDAFDLSKESAAVKAMYGDTPQGRQLLIARRLVERGVRFIQVWAGGWDHHEDLEDRLPASAAEIDKPAAALLADPATAAWSYFEMLTVMGWLVFGHIPDAWTIAGAAIVVLSGLYAWYRDRSDITSAKP